MIGIVLFMILVSMVASMVLFVPGFSFAAWTPLVAAADFAGITTDVQTVAAGIIGIMLVVVGIGILVRVLGR